MRKIGTIISLVFITFISFVGKANAVDVGIKFGSHGAVGDLQWSAEGNAGGRQAYIDHEKWVVYQGHDYPAYCVDPGQGLSGNMAYNCMPSNDAGLIEIMNQAGGTMANYSLYQLAFRMYASSVGIGNFMNLTLQRAAIIRYTQIKRGINVNAVQAPGFARMLPTDPSSYLSGSFVEQAWGIASNAINTRTGSLVSGAGGLVFTKTSESGGTVTYSITSTADIAKIKFKCLSNCTITGAADAGWSGRSGTLTIRVPNCNKYEIGAYYIPDGVQICTNKNSARAGNTQVLITKFTATETNIDTSGEPSQKFSDKSADPTICPQPCECNNTETEHHDVHNCCEEGTSSYAEEPKLDEMFCRYNEGLINVDKFCPTAWAKKYIDTDVNLNDYCELYCSEKVKTLTAGAQTSKAGMYFELNKISTPKGDTPFPYVTGAKRCRMEVQYHEWHEDYMEIIKKERDAYNKAQENWAHYEMWNEAIEKKVAETWTIKITRGETKGTNSCSATWKETKANCTKTATETCEEEKSDSVSVESKSLNPPGDKTDTITVYKFTPVPNNWKYNTIKIDDTKEKMNTYHDTITFKYDTTKTPSGSYVYWGDGLNKDPEKFDKVVNLKKDLDTWKATDNSNTEETKTYKTGKSTTDTCKSGKTTPTGSFSGLKTPREDPYKKRNDYETAAKVYNRALKGYASKAKIMEDEIDLCEKWFTKYDGANAEKHYDFDAQLSAVTYSQVYVTNFSELKNEVLPIGLSGGCEVTGPSFSGDGIMSTPIYDQKEFNKSGNYEKTIDFDAEAADGISYQKPSGGEEWKNYQHEQFEVEKKFVYDAKYDAECFWEESGNTQYTLVPTGEVGYSGFNYTENENEYKVYITTLEGKYEVEFFLTGLGSRKNGSGKFDHYWQESSSCSGSSEALHTCTLEVKHEIIYVGRCEPVTPSSSVERCNPKATDPVFSFKVVDPTNIFPSGTVYNGESYAKNWTDTSAGVAVMNEIKDTANRDETYAPSNVSYQFNLSVKTMNYIKQYNADRESDGSGGYDDFSLLCSCPSGGEGCHRKSDGTNTCYRPTSCNKCLSVFIDNAYNGYVNNHSADITIGDKSAARDGGNVHWTSQ